MKTSCENGQMQLRRTTHARVSANRSRQTGACATMPHRVFVG